MVTEKGLWYTTEAGKNWRKLPKPPSPLFRVYFTSEKDGWAVGAKESRFRKHNDGGEHWKAAGSGCRKPPGDKEFSAYKLGFFSNSEVRVYLRLEPARGGRFGMSLWPDWMDPEAAVTRRELPHLAYSLVTSDGREYLEKAPSASVFGVMTRAPRFQQRLRCRVRAAAI